MEDAGERSKDGMKGRMPDMKAKILWIEGKRADSPYFIPGLRKKGFVVETAPSGKAALKRLPDMEVDVVVVNAASLRTNGKRICQSLHDQVNGLPILLISSPEKKAPKNSCADVVLELPFTIRKLLNRINPLLPGEGEHVMYIGPIRLDLERNLVTCLSKESQLTPKLTFLLKMLMRHPGEVIERERLFRDVWKTDYTGDTRTLDVHISWLRQAIEEDPRNPRFLKTIRGVGYRLDV